MNGFSLLDWEDSASVLDKIKIGLTTATFDWSVGKQNKRFICPGILHYVMKLPFGIKYFNLTRIDRFLIKLCWESKQLIKTICCNFSYTTTWYFKGKVETYLTAFRGWFFLCLFMIENSLFQFSLGRFQYHQNKTTERKSLNSEDKLCYNVTLFRSTSGGRSVYY